MLIGTGCPMKYHAPTDQFTISADDLRRAMTSPLSSVGVGSNDSSAGSLALELAHPESMLRRTLTRQAARLRALAATMEEEGKCLKILGTTEKRIPNAFSRGAEMCGAADMARDWAANLEALLPNI